MKTSHSLLTFLFIFVIQSALAQAPNYVWAKRIGGTDIDDGRSIAVDAAGNSYTAGFFRGTIDADPGPGTTLITSLGLEDIFITKLDAAGNLVWTRRMGGASADFCYSVALDASGNVFTTGQFTGTADFDPGAAAFNMTSAGSWDVWISKLDAAGNFVWARQFGSTLADNGRTVNTDASGNVYTIGTFTGTVDFDPGAGTSNLTAPSGQDVFVSKLDASGNYVWAKSYGGTGTDDGRSIVVDATGNVFIAGSYSLTVDFDPGAGTFNQTSLGSTDVYLLKLNSAGNFVWALSMGGTLQDGNGGLALDASGNIHMVGSFSGTADFDPGVGTSNLVSSGSTDIFISKLDAAGTLVWAKRIGGTVADNGNCIAVDPYGNVYIGAGFNGTVDFDPGAGTFNQVSAGGYDAAIAKLDVSGNFVSAVRMGGILNDATYSLAYHSAGTIHSCGVFDDVVDFNPGTGTFNMTSAGASEVWIQKLCQLAPQPGIISGSATICSGTTNTYSITPVGTATSYTWSVPAGWTGTSTTNSINATSSLTSGNVSVIAVNACGSSPVQTLSVTVTPTPTVPTTITGNTTVCAGSSNTYSTGFVFGATSYNWTYPPGWTGPATSGIPSVATTAGASSGTITVTASNSCGTSGPRTLVVTVTPGVNSTASQTNVSCNGGTNGSATVVASGGTTPYTYAWSPSGGTAATATGLAAGTYSCTITDATGCSRTQTVTITQPTVLASSISSQTNVSCNGGANGVATVAVTGGTPGYTYSWAPSGGTAATATGLVANTYTCTITDANGCTRTQSVTITQPTAITSSVTSQTNLSCNGGSNGAATVAATGGVGAYTYAWAPSGGTSATATGLTAQTYTCTITDANGCTRQQTVTLTQPTAITSSISAQTNVACNGGSTGAATVAVSGGTPGYTYSWAPSGGTAATTTGRPAGTYTCTITDANGCTRTQTVTLTQPTAITSSVSSQTNVTCNGGSNGSATVLAGGGAPGYTYSWAPSGGTAATATGLSAQTYTCTITDANGCTRQQTVTITQPAGMTSTVTSQTNVSCNGGANGAATISVTGGTGPYTYSWAPSGGTAASITGRTAGVYTCTITDGGGCTRTQTVNITQPTAITASISSQTNVSCNGGNNGAATLSVSGGTPGYTYSWAPSGGTGSSISGRTAGTYTCTITDANACTSTQTVTLTQPTAITSSVSSMTNVSCNGGSNGAATVTVSGGAGGYSYAWSPAGGTSASATGLSATAYTCTITDANACTSTQTVLITQPSALTVTVSSQTDVSCNAGADGAATVTVSGGTAGYSYSWSPTGGTAAAASGLNAGTYTCTITDANSCTTSQTVAITQPAALSITVSSQTDVLCNGGNDGAAALLATGGTGGYTYQWLPTGGTSSSTNGLIAGTYSCVVTDASSCSATQTLIISEPTAISVTTSSTDITCNGSNDGTATVSASGGIPVYSYMWTPSGGTGTTESGLMPGAYTCDITDANGCSVTVSVTITEPSAIASSQTVNVCAGQSFTVGTSTYTVTGIYNDVLQAVNGCDSTVTTDLTVEPAIDVTTTLNANTVTANQNGATYQWIDCQNGNAPIAGETNQSFTAMANGDYAVIVTVGSCSDTSACLNVITGIESTSSASFSVYPNPTNGEVTIQLSHYSTDTQIEIFNSLGQLVITEKPANTTSAVQLPEENGMYLVRVTQNGVSTATRILKE